MLAAAVGVGICGTNTTTDDDDDENDDDNGTDGDEEATGETPNHRSDSIDGANGANTASADGSTRRGHWIPPPAGPINQAGTDRLCQAIADRIRVVREGGGGKIAIRVARSSSVGNWGTGRDGEDEEREEGRGGRRGSLGFAGGFVGGGEVEEAVKVDCVYCKFV